MHLERDGYQETRTDIDHLMLPLVRVFENNVGEVTGLRADVEEQEAIASLEEAVRISTLISKKRSSLGA